jgi:uncharacterized OB-fold protein
MERKILGYKCKSCGIVHYPYRMLCKKCGHEQFEAVPLPTSGKLVTFTHLYTLPGDFEVVNLTLGIVDLGDGVRVTGQLEIPSPEIGMKVRGTVKKVRADGYNTHYGMIFSAC